VNSNDDLRVFRKLRGASAILAALALATVPKPAPGADSDQYTRQSLLDRYCVACHGSKSATAGVVLENANPEHPDLHPEFWERVVRKLHAREMPPPGLPRPDAASLNGFTSALIGDLDSAYRSKPFAGRPVVRRLQSGTYSQSSFPSPLSFHPMALQRALTISATHFPCRLCCWNSI
jgi:hypothetical protein